MVEKEIISIPAKLFYGTAKQRFIKRILPINKEEKEEFIATEFAKMQKIGDPVIENIKRNFDDSNKKADILGRINNRDIGIQLTELKIEHRPHSAMKSIKLTNSLIELILKSLTPSFPIFVNICSTMDYQNKILKLNKKEINLLAETILKGIKEEKFSPPIDEIFKNKGAKLNYLDILEGLKKNISSIEINKINSNQEIYSQGKNNLHINFNFDSTISSDEIIFNLVEKIYEKKEGGDSEILLVWCSDMDFWFREEEIIRFLKEKFKKSGFESIYFFQFIDAEGLFEANKKAFVIK